MNRILKVEITLDLTNGQYMVAVIREYAPEYGGGSETFKLAGGSDLRLALEVAHSMVAPAVVGV